MQHLRHLSIVGMHSIKGLTEVQTSFSNEGGISGLIVYVGAMGLDAREKMRCYKYLPTDG